MSNDRNNDSPAPFGATSPYARNAQRYIDNGLPVIPIAPGTKMPGEFAAGRWRGMNDWRRYSVMLPTELQLDLWQAWPDAGIGMLLGPLPGVIAADVDTEDESHIRTLNQILPPSPVRKKGKKGWTSFYKYNGEVNKSWRINGKPVLDLLCEGRQTLMPGTIHPDGMTYVWITEDTLDTFDISQLPDLPKDFNEKMAQFIEPLMNEEDRKHLRYQNGPVDIDGEIPSNGFAASYFREINTQALYRLDEWVPKMIPTAKPNANGYRCKAFWRDAENLNVGITRQGIRDFGGDYGMTAIDLVMHAQNVTFPQASEALRAVLGIAMGDEPSFQIGKQAPPPPPRPTPKSTGHGPKEDADPMLAAREAQLRKEEEAREEEEVAQSVPDFIIQAPGMLGRIVGWMAETAPKYQPELFVAAALAVGATAMGRLYKTNLGNWPSLYIVMIAKTGEGKEHPQQCVSRILLSAGLDRLVAGAGYTSPGAVHSALMRSPSHLAIIDEMGKLLKMSRTNGSANSEAALDKLVEAFGKCNGFMKPAEYSKMNLTPAQAAGLTDKTVHNPAISLLGATTPATFYESLTNDLIGEGFLGRLIVVQSKRTRQKTRLNDQTPPPADVVDWVRSIAEEAGSDIVTSMNPLIPAVPVIMAFDEDSKALLDAFEEEIIRRKEEHEGDGMDALLARTREKAMRMAMIAAKAVNPPKDNTIRAEAVEWAIKYVRYFDLQAIKAVTEERSETIMHSLIRRACKIIGAAKKYNNREFASVLKLGGMPHSKLSRDMKLDKRSFQAMIDTAIEQNYISKTDGCPDAGYAGIVYWLRAEPKDDPDE